MKFALIVAVISASAPLRAASEALPQVLFSHCTVTVSESTFKKIKESKELAALARDSDLYTDTGTDRWHSYNVRGKHTHIEIQYEPEKDGDHTVYNGLGLYVDHPGDLLRVARQLKPVLGIRLQADATHQIKDGRKVPWFTSIGFSSSKTDLNTLFVMEVDPGFLLHQDAPIQNASINRESYEGAFDAAKALADVVGLEIRLKADEAKRTAQALKLLGWHITREGTGWRGVESDFAMRIIPVVRHFGIRQIDLYFGEALPRQSVELGDARLTTDGVRGMLEFALFD